MKPALRKLAVTAHVTFSIGWLGAVAAFLVLSIAGLISRDPDNADTFTMQSLAGLMGSAGFTAVTVNTSTLTMFENVANVAGMNTS